MPAPEHLRKGPSAVFHEPLEVVRVQLVRPNSEDVARTTCDKNLLRVAGHVPDVQRLSKLRDMDLDGLYGGRRWSIPPQLIDQPIDRDDFVSVEEEDGEKRALLDAAEANLETLRPDLDRAEDAKIHLLDRILTSFVG